jgi:hypothetical protein
MSDTAQTMSTTIETTTRQARTGRYLTDAELIRDAFERAYRREYRDLAFRELRGRFAWDRVADALAHRIAWWTVFDLGDTTATADLYRRVVYLTVSRRRRHLPPDRDTCRPSEAGPEPDACLSGLEEAER